MKTLLDTLKKQSSSRVKIGAWLGDGSHLSCGFEVVRSEARYRFDGMRTPALRKPPIGVFQYTLEGNGILKTPKKTVPVPVGHAFCVKVPSEHCYHNDPSCPEWSFIWMVFHHPYVIERVFSNADLTNTTIALPEESGPVQAVRTILELVQRRARHHPQMLEEWLFRWMLGLERYVFVRRHPTKPREQLLDQVRAFTLRHLGQVITVEDVAGSFGMSRTHFSHYFSRITGQVPATYMRELRLSEAARLLRGGSLSVKEIAAQTGFADANHLCKCFRSRFHMPPGIYRNLQG